MMRKSDGYGKDDFKSGLYCSVFRNADGTDCTLNGVTSRHKEVLLVGPDVDGPFSVEDAEQHGCPVLYLHSWTMRDGKVSYFASPDPGNGMDYMFGGNFIYTSDSRLPGRNAIKIHDRRER